MSEHVSECSLLRLNNIPLYGHITFLFIHPSLPWLFLSFDHLNNIAVNVGAQISSQVPTFTCFGLGHLVTLIYDTFEGKNTNLVSIITS
jgi:hypothetical protein